MSLKNKGKNQPSRCSFNESDNGPNEEKQSVVIIIKYSVYRYVAKRIRSFHKYCVVDSNIFVSIKKDVRKDKHMDIDAYAYGYAYAYAYGYMHMEKNVEHGEEDETRGEPSKKRHGERSAK